MKKAKRLRILFIGNSHTYYNDLPILVAERAREEGYDCDVTMIAHGGWYLSQHTEEPDVWFNIAYGRYDYVVLQEHSHPFGPAEKLNEAVKVLNAWIRDAGAKTVIYATWSKKDEPEKQKEMDIAFRNIAEETGAILAPVGESWWTYQRSYPNLDLYADDGAHAAFAGSDFAAKHIWVAIRTDLYRAKLREKQLAEKDQP
ncbi:MAG: hypothetical protein HUJ72_04035 [Blautia sp.]|nr:hypothetical protein [Blautia sp.]